ncbi:cupin domain-containing protein [Rhodococcus sp. T2V]|uniref:cupin domain-containing protein n=1 Tax=Rhodococcus sp. T2V TaxID=3034164 RepID=UPI0023E1C651|nr:cupin domain-containing protein [Rhodococcus sp. T2V]MDF3312661.1 cupin domain-containing protein [Rhodococcus sp. T2V]
MTQKVAGRTPSVIDAVRLDDVALEPSLIDPTWILDGMPKARGGRWTQSLDGTTTHWVWDCTAGTFNWYFALKETVQILEGEVTVSSADQPPRTLRVGDAAVFPAHTWAQWHIPRYVRKHAILRPHTPRPMRILMRFHGIVASTMRPRGRRRALSS